MFLNGVRQEEGSDYRIDGRTLVFDRELRTEGKLGFWRWLSLWVGIAGHIPAERLRRRRVSAQREARGGGQASARAALVALARAGMGAHVLLELPEKGSELVDLLGAEARSTAGG